MEFETEILNGLPAESIIRKGLKDLKNKRTSIESCLVSIAAPRLRTVGLMTDLFLSDSGELTLYRLLLEQNRDPYSQYNSLLRELVSFEHALDSRIVKMESA